jgi:hypothetical protein
MRSREDWIEEIVRRQDNIDPIRRIPNGASFQATLINGTRHLNKVQRLGVLILGLFGLAFGCFSRAEVIAALRAWSLDHSVLTLGIFCPFSLWIGWKITMNALIDSPRKPPGKIK